ncbi:MAG: hypothetical protein Q9179_003868 [Wetmoreana sp. 5 TL-2023]
MKRKRGSGDHSRQQTPPAKRQTEHLSHINIPKAVNESPSTPNHPRSDREDQDRPVPQASHQDRTDRMDWQHAQKDRQSLPNPGTGPNSRPPLQQQLEAREPTAKVVGPSSEQLQQSIEAQFSLEILLKHRELRLIDQEIAKCQVALEQLRRCQVIPYPAMSSNWEDLQAVATGRGQTLENNAPNAPPWGVTSGPYTRHYQHWLIPDRTFGNHVAEERSTSQPYVTHSERSVRASTAGKSSLAATTRAQRGTGSARLKALPHGYPEPKEDKGPMILKRSTDGQMVKLVCLDCRRSDFNSVQGFINHCRIAHSRNFQSHDAAAIACGEEVELDQAGGIVGETSTAATSGAGLVHPLIRSPHVAKLAAPTSPMRLTKRESSGAQTPARASLLSESRIGQTPDRSDTPGNTVASRPSLALFKPSPQTPHLSALFVRIGRGGDLEEKVTDATTKMDLDSFMSSDDEAEDDVEASQPLSGPASHSTRGLVRPDQPPSRAVMAPAQMDGSPSSKPATAGSNKPKNLAHMASRPADPTSMHLRGAGPSNGNQTSFNQERRIHDSPSSPNLSPNTIESHQAPSLISDDDDYENTHSEWSSSADVAEDLDGHYLGMDFDSHDDQAMGDLEGAGSSAGAEHLGLGTQSKVSSHLNQQPQRSSAMRSPDAIRDPTTNHERRVSFASPNRRPRKKGGK